MTYCVSQRGRPRLRCAGYDERLACHRRFVAAANSSSIHGPRTTGRSGSMSSPPRADTDPPRSIRSVQRNVNPRFTLHSHSGPRCSTLNNSTAGGSSPWWVAEQGPTFVRCASDRPEVMHGSSARVMSTAVPFPNHPAQFVLQIYVNNQTVHNKLFTTGCSAQLTHRSPQLRCKAKR